MVASGRAEFMRDVGHEVAFRPFQPLDGCHVVQDGDYAAPGTAGERRRINVECGASGHERFQPLADDFAGVGYVLDDFVEPAVADHSDERHAFNVGLAAYRVHERIIAERDVEPGIDGQNSVRHAGQNGFPPHQFRAELIDQFADLGSDVR